VPFIRSRPSTDTKAISALILVFPASKTVSNKFLSFKNYPSKVICYSSLTGPKQISTFTSTAISV
jgi:hypothetical protein